MPLCLFAASFLLFVTRPVHAAPAASSVLPQYSDDQLLTEVQRRACLFFLEKSDPTTGLTQDRARNDGADHFTVASIASTGYALASLPVAVEHGWASRADARIRALRTLRFLHDRLPQEHGFFYHFVDKQTGARAWNSEVSSIDTGILLCGALVCGQYFGGDAGQLATDLYERADWNWVRTNGNQKPEKLVLSQGWKPETGFLPYDYGSYCEALLLYLLGAGSSTHPLPAASWAALKRPVVRYGGHVTLAGGPIFIHQMPHSFFPLQGRRDNLGYDYGAASTEATLINRIYCLDRMGDRRAYGPNFWGLNASDSPGGYHAFGAPQGPEDGTLSPTGALASIIFTPELSTAAAQAMYHCYGDRLWGRYGFGDAYNLDRNWFDPEVIGIDLGMALLSIENHRTGLVWRLVEAQPFASRAFTAVGLHPTAVAGPRILNPALVPPDCPQPVHPSG